VAGDHTWVGLEGLERRRECGVAVDDAGVEAIVGRALLRHLPNALDAVELGRVRLKSEQLYAMMMVGEPSLSDRIELVAGPIVDDEKHLSTRAPPHQLV
jgi:hypothetical protein